ncbi:hypothetical protein [Celeribacter sp.]|uniref:hypothetical protein n=1 Tax=Celeribacter sp. TaxID=1890673 RepID=UPI003A8E689E
MRALFVSVVLSFAVTPPVVAQDWHEPARGSLERTQIMNALRPVIEWRLGAPVEFVVYELRSTGERAFASLAPQRPGGGTIDIREAPMVRYWGDDASYFEEVGGLDVIAFLIREGDQWAVIDHSIGATDVWFAAEPYCTVFPELLFDYCPLN